MFDVDFGEKFTLVNNEHRTFMFDKRLGLIELINKNGDYVELAEMLQLLITDKFKIKKLPWCAKCKETYCVPLMDLAGVDVKYLEYNDSSTDLSYYMNGLMCKTKEQALKLGQLLSKTAKKFQGFEVK